MESQEEFENIKSLDRIMFYLSNIHNQNQYSWVVIRDFLPGSNVPVLKG
jgi:hypothetical protein